MSIYGTCSRCAPLCFEYGFAVYSSGFESLVSHRGDSITPLMFLSLLVCVPVSARICKKTNAVIIDTLTKPGMIGNLDPMGFWIIPNNVLVV